MPLIPLQSNDFSGMRLKLASPERILQWSYGEVTRPETINYRTQKPEKAGLFAEEIFGPSKDWECFCGKYKKIRYKGIICDKCGVEVTRSIVRRERMGAIRLATPVSHIWFLRGVPSKIGIVLDLSVQNLEKVIYFANFIITSIDETAKQQTIEQIREEYKSKRKQFENDGARKIQEIENQARKEQTPSSATPSDTTVMAETPALSKKTIAAIEAISREKETRLAELEEAFAIAEEELKELTPLAMLSEHAYQSLSLKYGHVFDAKIGAEAIHYLLQSLKIEETMTILEKEAASVDGARREKIMRRLKLLKSFIKNKIHPSWMMLTVIPVIPPDLRPMVPLDGGRYATSDLNDLYRRVINRNNRLKQLQELNAPEVIVRNEKRMLQEAVDALIDNSARHGKTVMASTGQKRMLKSLADMLKGKQGRFRQNLLGKRVDYSGRSVIVVGPHLKLGQCGLPKKMAMELFKPFVMSKLIQRGYVHNVRSASRFIESGRAEIWDILEEITKDKLVLLNRAPTLHRLGIQAFQPILIEGKAIQLHPLVCAAFNADFDGDQMAVHVPLTEEAQTEARELMLSTKNLLKPATGDPVMTPNQDIVLGSYYLTFAEDAAPSEQKRYTNSDEVLLAYRLRTIPLQRQVMVRMLGWHQEASGADEKGFLVTTPGRLIFNQVLPSKIPFQNQLMDKKKLGKLVRHVLQEYGTELTAALLDDMKELAFKHLTRSGLSWGMSDLPVLEGKKPLVVEAHRMVDEVQSQFENGLLTESERRVKVISIWNDVKEKVVELSKRALDTGGPVFSMIDSGARGSWGQLTQMIGMKGLVTNPTGEIIELPVKGSFKEGFTVLEYFISTHGARKGLSDTALRTANAGYLTRRLVDVAQELVVREEDCGDTNGMLITQEESEAMGEPVLERIAGRVVVDTIKHPETKKVIVKKGEHVTEAVMKLLKDLPLKEVRVRSLLTCRSRKGVCQHCYGYDLGYNRPVSLGVPVGIIAAQSIGEPGTQLTMRTFHTGGVAGQDITQGLPRVEEIFEVRPPKKRAFIAEVSGRVHLTEAVEVADENEKTGAVKSGRRQKMIQIFYRGNAEETYAFADSGAIPVATSGKPGEAGSGSAGKKKRGRTKKVVAGAGGDVTVKVKDGARVQEGVVLFIDRKDAEVLSRSAGIVRVTPDSVTIIRELDQVKEYVIPFGYGISVKEGDEVRVGDALTEGSLDLHQLFSLKGKEAVQKYVIREIQSIYTSQGQKVNDKHIEAIVRQMFSRGYVKKSGDTNLLPSETVEKSEYLDENDRVARDGTEAAEADELLLGISRVSLSTQSFLASASFQETARVLINAAIMGRVDHLEGLKENVIIGRLIPAGTGFQKEIIVKADAAPKVAEVAAKEV